MVTLLRHAVRPPVLRAAAAIVPAGPARAEALSYLFFLGLVALTFLV